MIFFVLGILFGISLALVVFLAFIYCSAKGNNFVKRAVDKVEKLAKPKAVIFEAPTEEEAAQQEIIERNEAEGKPTEAKELGL